MSRKARCPECHRVFPVKPPDRPAAEVLYDTDVFPKHFPGDFSGPTTTFCQGSRWLVEEENYVDEGP